MNSVSPRAAPRFFVRLWAAGRVWQFGTPSVRPGLVRYSWQMSEAVQADAADK
jgi:hypothetical protein